MLLKKLNNKSLKVNDYLKQYLSKYSYISNLIYNNFGFCVYVGGVVRDIIISAFYDYCPNISDIDIEVYLLTMQEIKDILDNNNIRYILVGESFGVIKLVDFNIDLSLPRYDNTIGVRHKDINVVYDIYANFKKISKRRDFKMNSIGYNYEYNVVLDPNNGINDIKKKCIDIINKSFFIQDPLRILRSLYFYARFDFVLSKKLINIILSNIILINNISIERIANEIYKILIYENNYIDIFSYLSLLYLKTQNSIYYFLHQMHINSNKNLMFSYIVAQDIFYFKLFIIFVYNDIINIDLFYRIHNIKKNKVVEIKLYSHLFNLINDNCNLFLFIINNLKLCYSEAYKVLGYSFSGKYNFLYNKYAFCNSFANFILDMKSLIFSINKNNKKSLYIYNNVILICEKNFINFQKNNYLYDYMYLYIINISYST